MKALSGTHVFNQLLIVFELRVFRKDELNKEDLPYKEKIPFLVELDGWITVSKTRTHLQHGLSGSLKFYKVSLCRIPVQTQNHGFRLFRYDRCPQLANFEQCQRPLLPVLNQVLAHVSSLPRASAARQVARNALQGGNADTAALLLP